MLMLEGIDDFQAALDFALRLKEVLITKKDDCDAYPNVIEFTLALALLTWRFPGLRLWIQEIIFTWSSLLMIEESSTASTKSLNTKFLRILFQRGYLYRDDALIINVGSVLSQCNNADMFLRFESMSLYFEALRLPDSAKMRKLQECVTPHSTWEDSAACDLFIESLLSGGDVMSGGSETTNNLLQSIVSHWSTLRKKIFDSIPLGIKMRNNLVTLGDISLPIKSGAKESSRLHHCETTSSNLRKLAESLLSFQPILVQGPAGAGKSSSIRELASLIGHDGDLVTLHLNDQSDSKALIGSYTCTDVPGEFMWQSGVITQAVINGYWVVIEDVDKVPIDFVALLAPLLESRQLFLPHHHSPIIAHYNFRLFATRSVHEAAREDELRFVHSLRHFSYLWQFVTIGAIPMTETQQIVCAVYPSMPEELLEKLCKVFEEVSKADSLELDDEEGGGGGVAGRHTHLQLLKRKWTLRDFLKICSRMAHHCASAVNASGYVTDESKIRALMDIVDVIIAGTRNSEQFLQLAKHVGKRWGLMASEVEHRVLLANPSVQIADLVDAHQGPCAVVNVGRAKFLCNKESLLEGGDLSKQTFAQTCYARRLLEKVAVCVEMNEPILLVGETGTGKTTTIQELARVLGKKLIVQNLSLSSDVSDLLGGYRPVTIRQMILPAYETFVRLFQDTLSTSKNTDFLQIVAQLFKEQKWRKLLKAFDKACGSSISKLSSSSKAASKAKLEEWTDFHETVKKYNANLAKIESGFAFSFQKGLLVEALQQGHWILMDEINLASAETLQGLSGFLDPDDKVVLADCGNSDLKAIKRHPDFRVFAAMNPPTDVCKKELPSSLRSRFTELYVDEMTDMQDLMLVVEKYMTGIQDAPVADIVQVYLGCRAAAEENLVDGTGQRPRYSLRSLTRSLRATNSFLKMGMRPLGRCLFEAFLLNFQTMLAENCRNFMFEFLKNSLYAEGNKKDLNFPPQRPGGRGTTVDDWSLVKPFWLRTGKLPPVDWSEKSESGIVRFVGTPTVMNNIRTVAAGIAANVAPILLQGPTSIGKTTMVQFLAAKTGHRCVRINNHEHTDVQEYIGGYVTGADGQLVFQDGLLVEALRNGYWIILDELNLAPSDVLEALNRLLDDNRELLIPETGEIVKPAPGFQLFATQNPPGIYGGRKPLSLAFRNRFVEIDLTDLPSVEVEEIITKSCGIAPKFSSMLVKIMVEIQIQRQKSNLLLGKHGTVTTRDLIKWGYRQPSSALEVAKEGFMIIGEKLRSLEEKVLIGSILETVCKVKLDAVEIYEQDESLQLAQSTFKSGKMHIEGVGGIAITSSFKRMWTLLSRALQHKEPVLLVGETGCGKTMVCQLFSAFNNRDLRIVNCHQSTETADFIGGLRPVRGRDAIRQSLVDKVNALVAQVHALVPSSAANAVSLSTEDAEIKSAIEQLMSELSAINIDEAPKKISKKDKKFSSNTNSQGEAVRRLLIEANDCNTLWMRLKALFEWEDGPLVKAMKVGDVFLMDEINLADDAVIERLNSVLEFNREITLAEKGGLEAERLHAHDNFRIIATMNPSGDFGKRELSPALRSRFTEIWVPAISDLSEMVLIISEVLRLSSQSIAGATDTICADIAGKMLEFMTWVNARVANVITGSLIMTIRETLAWANFIAQLNPRSVQHVYASYVHGAFLTILDGLGIGQSVSREKVQEIKLDSFEKLLELCAPETREFVRDSASFLLCSSNNSVTPVVAENKFQVGIFGTPLGASYSPTAHDQKIHQYALDASSTVLNLGRILRGLQIKRPILLEGPPGVGKSSLVTNLARATGHKLIRINLSEHSELSDLLGSDLPVSSEDDADNQSSGGVATPKFKWCDGIFLTAMKEGSWVLLDELNLAPQTVLEGLNACFDHREQVFLPEIGQVVQCAPTFRVFCAQNPMLEGGGRKGLPASFLSRFTRVYIESMSEKDLIDVVHRVARLGVSTADESNRIVESMIHFIGRLSDDVTVKGLYGREGFPWEFNLRDTFRWCELFEAMSRMHLEESESETLSEDLRQRILAESAYMLFTLRMRSVGDRTEVARSFLDCFGFPLSVAAQPTLQFNPSGSISLGSASLPVTLNPSLRCSSMHGFTGGARLFEGLGNEKNLEVLANCVALKWPALLAGTAGSGKRRTIEALAALTGHQLRYFCAMPSLDSTEILGSFEQTNVFHVLHQIVVQLEHSTMALLSHLTANSENSLFSAPAENSSQVIAKVSSLLSFLQAYMADSKRFSLGETGSLMLADSPVVQDLQHLLNSLWKILHQEEVLAFAQSRGLIHIAEHVAEQMKVLLGAKSQGAFAWENGIIVEALTQGHWLVFDNVNLASASVLDRLNSVLEPNGNLVLTEDGSGKTITPHENFRIFFIMDPSFGEVSRAMRNRCVEIFYNPLENRNEALAFHRKSVKGLDDSLSSAFHESVSRFPHQSATTPCDYMNTVRRRLHHVSSNKLRKDIGLSVDNEGEEDDSRHTTAGVALEVLAWNHGLLSDTEFTLLNLLLRTAREEGHASAERQQWTHHILDAALKRIHATPGSWLHDTLSAENKLKALAQQATQGEEEADDSLASRDTMLALFEAHQLVQQQQHDEGRGSLATWFSKDLDLRVFESIRATLGAEELEDEKEMESFLRFVLVHRGAAIAREHRTLAASKTSEKYNYQNGQTLSLLSLCSLLQSTFVPVDCKELAALHGLAAVLSVGTHWLVAATAAAVKRGAEDENLLSDAITNAWQKRDILVQCLIQREISVDRIKSLRWDDVLIATKWFDKAVRALFQRGSAFLSSIDRVEESTRKFFLAVNDIWGAFVDVKKLRLWKESGSPTIPVDSAAWEQLVHIRAMIHSEGFNTYATRSDKCTGVVSRHADVAALLQEWLGLYSTYYWGCTNEIRRVNQFAADDELPVKFQATTFDALIAALREKLDAYRAQHPSVTIAEMEEKIAAMDFHERDTYLFSDPLIYQRIEEDRNVRRTVSAFMLAETTVLANLDTIASLLSELLLLRASSEPLNNNAELVSTLRVLSSIVKDTCKLALQATAFDPTFLRELQTLSWCLDYCLANTSSSTRFQSAMKYLLGLSRIFFASLDASLLGLYQNRHSEASVDSLDVSYCTPMLRYISNSEKAQSISSSVTAAGAAALQSLDASSRLTNCCKSLAIELAVKHVDPRLLFPHVDALNLVAPRGSTGYAEVTVQSHKDATQSLLLLFMSALHQRQAKKTHENWLNAPKLALYVFDILFACRDFFSGDALLALQMIQAAFTAQRERDVCALCAALLAETSLWDSVRASSSRLDELFSLCLLPSLRVLAAHQEQGDVNSVSRLESGVCWTLLGALRLHLLAPLLPIDPATRAARKQALLQDDCATRNATLATELRVNALAGAPLISSAAAVRDACFVHDVEKKMDFYNLRKIERFDHNGTQFEDLHSELRGMLGGALEVSNLANLVDEFQAFSAATKSAAKRVSSHKSLTQRVSTLQQTLRSICERLQSTFFAFEDVTVPLQAAMENVSRGLTLLQCHTQDASNAPVNALLAFVDDLWKNKEKGETNDNYEHFEGLLESIVKTFPYLHDAKKDALGGLVHAFQQHLQFSTIDYCEANALCDSAQSTRAMRSLLTDFTERYLAAQREKAQAEAKKNALYQYKDDVDVEAVAEEKRFRASFPDHLADLARFVDSPDHPAGSAADMDVDEDGDELQETQEEVETTDYSLANLYDDGLVSAIIAMHARTTLLYSDSTTATAAATTGSLALLLSPHSQRVSARQAVEQQRLLESALSRSRVLMTKLSERVLMNTFSTQFVDLAAQHTLPLLSYTTQSLKVSKDTTSPAWFSQQHDSSAHIDRDLLLLLDGDGFAMTADAATAYRPISFHFDPNPSEVLLAEQPLQRMFQRCAELLVTFPGNELLLKLCKLVIQVSQYHVSVPLGKMLVAMQVLLKCAQEWENYAARHVSVSAEMSAISGLISRWRTLELKSWEHLLRSEEIQFARRATGMWFHLHRIFTKDLSALGGGSAGQRRVVSKDLESVAIVWETLLRNAPAWLFAGSVAAHSATESAGEDEENANKTTAAWDANALENFSSADEFFKKFVATIDMFLRTASVGEFPTRLHMIRLMALSLQKNRPAHTQREKKSERAHREAHAQFERMTLGVWQYYQQFLPTVRKFQDLLRVPLQQKVKDEIKLGKWDSLNVYALMESADKIHRKLSKFVRDYSTEVLEFPLHSLLQRELMKGFVNEAGQIVPVYEVPETHVLFPQVCRDATEQGEELVSALAEQFAERYIFESDENRAKKKKPSLALISSKDLAEKFPRIARLDSLTEKIRLYLASWLDFSTFLPDEDEENEDTEEKKKEESESGAELCFGLSVADSSERMVGEIFHRIQSLRGEAATKPLKLKAVRDLMETLRDHGFSHLRGDIPQSARESTQVLSIASTLPTMLAADVYFGNAASSAARDLLEKGEAYYVRNLAELPQLRTQAVTAHSKDVSQRDALCMVAFGESLMFHAMRVRVAVDASLDEFGAFAGTLNTLGEAIHFRREIAANAARNEFSELAFHFQSSDEVMERVRSEARVALHVVLQLEALSNTANDARAMQQDESSARVAMLKNGVFDGVLQPVGELSGAVKEMVACLGAVLSTHYSEQIADLSQYNTQQQQQGEREGEEDEESDSTATQLVTFPALQRIFSLSPAARLSSSSSPLEEEMKRTRALLQKALDVAYKARRGVVLAQSESSFALLAARLASAVAHCDKYIAGLSASPSTASISAAEKEDSPHVVKLLSAANKTVDQCLISIQRLKSLVAAVSGTEESASTAVCMGGAFAESVLPKTSEEKHALTLQIARMVSTLATFKLDRVTSAAREMNALVTSRESVSLSAQDAALELQVLTKTRRLLDVLRGAYQALLDQLCVGHKSHNKLAYIVIRVFRNLLAKGICAQDTSDEEDDGKQSDPQKMLFEDDVEGTGMGEGEGKKDVSDQIENEEQLLGTKKEKLDNEDTAPKEKQPDKKLDKEEKDKGVEMSEDFDGEMFDVPSDEENDKENEDEEDDKEEPDREMGETNMEDIVDEKQWGSDDEEDEKDKDSGEQGKEKFEDESKAKGDILEGEMHTRDEDEDGKDKDDTKPDETQNGDKPQQEDADDAENEHNDKDDKINEDNEEDHMERPMGVKVREEEEREGDEDGEQGGEPDVDAGGEQDDGKDGDDENGADLPDDMQLGGDEQDGEDHGDKMDDEEDGEGEDDPTHEDPNQEPSPDDEPSNEEDKDDENDNAMANGANGGNLPEQESEQPEAEPEEMDATHADNPTENNKEEQENKPAVHGVHSADGKDSILNPPEEQQQQDAQRNASSAQPDDDDAGGDGSNNNRDGAGDAGELTNQHGSSQSDPQSSKERQKKDQFEPPNPFMSKGDVQKKWFRRLNMVESDVAPKIQDEQRDDDESDSEENGGDDEKNNKDGKGQFEFSPDQNDKDAEQVLGKVDADEAVQLPDSGEIPPADKEKSENDAFDEEQPSEDKSAKRERPQEEDQDKGEGNQGPQSKRKRSDDVHKERSAVDDAMSVEDEKDDSLSEDGADYDVNENSDDEGEDGVEKKDPASVDVPIHTNRQFRFAGKDAFPEEQGDDEEEDEMRLQSAPKDALLDVSAARAQWQQHRVSTESHAIRLSEQLRLILEPTLATRLQGDYRTGKRINMRKVIPYIASGFRKDKIWLRRTKPAKRDYQVMLLIDDSKSMGLAGELAMSSLALLSTAMTRLEIGELCVASFAEQVNILHPFGVPFTEDTGARVVSQFDFNANYTRLGESLKSILPIFSQARENLSSASSGGNSAVLQLCFVISDARIDTDNRTKLEHIIRTMSEQNILVVLVIIDCNENARDSIFNTKTVSFVGDKVVTKSYFDSFPFPYYVAIQNLQALPEVLADALKQWFELIRLQMNNS